MSLKTADPRTDNSILSGSSGFLDHSADPGPRITRREARYREGPRREALRDRRADKWPIIRRHVVRWLLRPPLASSFLVVVVLMAILVPALGGGPQEQNFTVVPADPKPSGQTGSSSTTLSPTTLSPTTSSPTTSSPVTSSWGSSSSGTLFPATSSRQTLTGPDALAPTSTDPSSSAPPETEPPKTQPSKTQPTNTQPTNTQPTNTQPTATQQPAPTRSSGGSSSAGSGSSVAAGSTGVPNGTDLTVHHGDLVITQAGATYDALDIRGFVVVEAPNVTIRRSIVRGGVASSSKALVSDTSAAGRGFLIEDSELVPDHPSVSIDGLAGWGFTARRLNIHGTVDAVKVFGDDVRLESSWLHDLAYYDSDPYQNGGPTHNDGVQVLGGNDITVAGNRISVAAKDNSGLQVTQDHGATTDLVFRGNQVDGGSCSVKLSHKGGSSLGPITVSGNTFGRDTGIDGCAVLATHATRLSADANRWRDTGAAVTPVIYG